MVRRRINAASSVNRIPRRRPAVIPGRLGDNLRPTIPKVASPVAIPDGGAGAVRLSLEKRREPMRGLILPAAQAEQPVVQLRSSRRHNRAP